MPGGGEEHGNLEGAEVFDMGGGFRVGQALPPPCGKETMTKAEGRSRMPPVAPALVALLQQAPATKLVIVGRLACAEDDQAQSLQ